MTEFLDSLGVNRDLAIVILIMIIVVLLAICLIMVFSTRRLFKRYDFFMRGKDAESLEDVIMNTNTKMYNLQDLALENRDRLRLIQSGINGAFHKIGIVKYNAFEGMGGESSFVLVMLDDDDTGILLNAMHSRTSCYMYIKEIKKGVPESELGKEEKEAVEKAINQ